MNSILSEGLALMCIGMGTVLTFLCLLILSMQVMSFVVGKLNKIFPETVNSAPSPVLSSNDEVIAVAIAAAIAKK